MGDDAPFGLFQLLLAQCPHGVPKAPVVERRGGRCNQRSAAVFAHQSEKASLEQGSQARLRAARAM